MSIKQRSLIALVDNATGSQYAQSGSAVVGTLGVVCCALVYQAARSGDGFAGQERRLCACRYGAKGFAKERDSWKN